MYTQLSGAIQHFYIKGAGMLVVHFGNNSLKETNLGVAQAFLYRKRYQNTYVCVYFSVCNLKREHEGWKYWRFAQYTLSETKHPRILAPFIWESPWNFTVYKRFMFAFWNLFYYILVSICD